MLLIYPKGSRNIHCIGRETRDETKSPGGGSRWQEDRFFCACKDVAQHCMWRRATLTFDTCSGWPGENHRNSCRNYGATLAKPRYLRYPIYFRMRLIDQRRGVSAQVKRLEQTLNKPIVVLVVGVIAVALNVLLYFGYFLPRTAPLVEQIYSIGTSLPEAISNSDSETGSKSDPEAGSKSDPETGGTSGSETGSGSDPEASGTSGSEASGGSVSDSSSSSPSGSAAVSPQSQQESSATPQSPSGSPPELPPLPTPSQEQYQ